MKSITMKEIAKKYRQVSAASREVHFEARTAMYPSVSGVKRSLTIPLYARKDARMIKAYIVRVNDFR